MSRAEMAKKNRKRKGRATHYAYLGGGGRSGDRGEDFSQCIPRKVTKVLNLDGVSVPRRREVVDRLIKEGECLARLPVQFELNCDMDELERFLNGEL